MSDVIVQSCEAVCGRVDEIQERDVTDTMREASFLRNKKFRIGMQYLFIQNS